MPDEPEVETKDLQEAIEELHEEREEREAAEKKAGWTKYVGLSTAILAVFAAVGALESGGLVNEAMMNQLASSDAWGEYQASREKEHMYTLSLNAILDANPHGAKPSKPKAASQKPPVTPSAGAEGTPKAALKKPNGFRSEPPAARTHEYESEIDKERAKEKKLQEKATELKKESEHQLRKHHDFAYCVALIQVAIALGAVSALTRVRSVWYMSMAAGAIGIVLFVIGFIK